VQEARLISDYLDQLGAALRFDRSLSRGVVREVEDHLQEAAAADTVGDRREAERRAIARFGDPRAIAAQFASVSVARQAKRTGAALILVVAGVFVTMKSRVVWYAVTQWTVSDDMKAVSGIAGLVDRYSFWSSVVVAIGGFAYINSRRVSPILDAGYRRQLRLAFILCLVATTFLAVSVLSEGVLTALHLRRTELDAGVLVPIISMAIEAAGVGVLAFQIRSMTRKALSVAALLTTQATGCKVSPRPVVCPR
jgi:hypothetical protein